MALLSECICGKIHLACCLEKSRDRCIRNCTACGRTRKKHKVQNLLQQMQSRFQTMSESIITKIDEMGTRIDELEQSINELRAEMGTEGSPSPSITPIPKADDSKTEADSG